MQNLLQDTRTNGEHKDVEDLTRDRFHKPWSYMFRGVEYDMYTKFRSSSTRRRADLVVMVVNLCGEPEVEGWGRMCASPLKGSPKGALLSWARRRSTRQARPS